MIKKLFKTILSKYTEAEKEISARQSNHKTMQEQIAQNHENIGVRINEIRNDFGFTQCK